MEINNFSTTTSCLHIAMYPWFAFGHITPYLHISNKLAQKGHKISFLIPTKTQLKFQHHNHFPYLITFVPIAVPHVDGLPSGAETTYDVPSSLYPLIMTAMDRTEPDIELLLRDLKPDIVFFDFPYWVPKLAHRLGFKALYYSIVSSVTTAYNSVPVRHLSGKFSKADLMQPPPGFPDSSINLHSHEAQAFVSRRAMKFSNDVLFSDCIFTSLSECDALGLKACREIDGPFVGYLERQFKKPILLAGPVIPEPPNSAMEEKWAKWLGRFEPSSVIYCALGSEWVLQKCQFQELLLGLELSGSPFLAVLKPPSGAETVEEALPDGFLERVGERGVVHGGWIQQQLVLGHPSIGCFITHCGSGSLTEALVNQCQLVMIPHEKDHIFQARMISNTLKAGVEVERGEEDGCFTGESVCKAIRTVMDKEEHCNEVGREVRANRAKLQKLLQSKDLEAGYIDDFSLKLQALVLA